MIKYNCTRSTPYETNSTFRNSKTSKTCETSDQLSLESGVGVTIPYLASVNVKRTYDEHIQENEDSDKMSLTLNCRAGTIEFQSQPRLTTEAIKEIRYGGGYEALCQRNGDFYLVG